MKREPISEGDLLAQGWQETSPGQYRRVVRVAGAHDVRVPQNPAPARPGPKKANLKPKLVTPEQRLNRLELAFLQFVRGTWKYQHLGIHDAKLRIAHDCWYWPDFTIVADGVVRFYETKGPFAREDSIIKIKAVAAIHRWAGFYLVTRGDAREMKCWKIKCVQP